MLTSVTIFAQYKMRPVDALINRTDPGWMVVKEWIDSAKNKVEVLPVDTLKAKNALYKTQVTTRSIMGAIVFSTGGILIDDGWIRILGSGKGHYLIGTKGKHLWSLVTGPHSSWLQTMQREDILQ